MSSCSTKQTTDCMQNHHWPTHSSIVTWYLSEGQSTLPFQLLDWLTSARSILIMFLIKILRIQIFQFLSILNLILYSSAVFIIQTFCLQTFTFYSNFREQRWKVLRWVNYWKNQTFHIWGNDCCMFWSTGSSNPKTIFLNVSKWLKSASLFFCLCSKHIRKEIWPDLSARFSMNTTSLIASSVKVSTVASS